MSRLLLRDLERIAAQTREDLNKYKTMLMVCTGTGCVSAKGFHVRDALEKAVNDRGLGHECIVIPTGCNGFCAVGPIVVVQPDGVFYQKVSDRDAAEIVDAHLVGGTPVERLMHRDPVSGAINSTMEEIDFFSKQQLIALRNKGLIDPENIDHYIARGGYSAIRDIFETWQPERVIQAVTASGIRGRGGGGFFQSRKDRSTLSLHAETPHLQRGRNPRLRAAISLSSFSSRGWGRPDALRCPSRALEAIQLLHAELQDSV